MTHILKGDVVAESIDRKTTDMVKQLKRHGVDPVLAIIRVGEKNDTVAYERNAIKRCKCVGIEVHSTVFTPTVSQSTLESLIDRLNDDEKIHGILICRPLPDHLDQRAIDAVLDPDKDVDGVTEESFAKVYSGRGKGFVPCAAQACKEILDHYDIEVSGKRVVVIGHSLVVGRPVAMLLMAQDATPTICHLRTENICNITRSGDIVIVATGCTDVIGADYFREGQIIIDVGIGWSEQRKRLFGDVVFEEVEPLAWAISPVPGGVGTVTASVLANHVAQAAGSISRKASSLSF